MSLLSLLREDRREKSFNDIKNFSETISGSSNIVRYEDTYEMPIEVTNKNNGWHTLDAPERLVKVYTFDDMKEVIYFTNELYKYQFDINHHCKIIIDNLSVTVETYTHGFEGVTDTDLKIKKMSDELYGDLVYFKSK